MNFKAIEQKWQDKWDKDEVFKVVKDENKQKFYVLEMFPYPSGNGLHMGHAFNYTIGDIYSRFKTMNGFNVLHPMGYDALGLPAENAAIKEGTHPEEYTQKSTANYIKQQKKIGLSYDWSRIINTSEPKYYKWDQWIFLQMLKKGLAYQKESSVNWCTKCDTVLANEQVQNGKCWRHEDTNVEIKKLKQWFFKTTAYANELYDNIDKLNWPERTKAMQKNWIGKSHGTEINFTINKNTWPVFTTRPDTIFGVTFVVVSAQHTKLFDLVTDDKKDDVNNFLKKLKSVSEKDLGDMEKEGVFTGSYAINPANNEKVPVYAGNFVVADYGSGMVMAVPAHDQRDFEFAKKYNIEIKQVIEGNITEKRAYTDSGKLVNSKQFDGMDNVRAKEEITKWLGENNKGKKVTNFKLRDWGISRQRYWGTPIPIIYCDKCGAVPVSEKDLPVELPKDITFGKGNPLETSKEYANVKCPKCDRHARRETDTMDTFVNSSWYFLRYADPNNNEIIFNKNDANYWAPIDLYIGGAEHACMHLIYSRFYTKFLRDLGLLDFGEPAKKLFHQGMLHGENGEKMSKSKGNVVLPEVVSEKYGMDTARLFLVSNAGADKDFDWDTAGIEGSLKLINKINDYITNVKFGNTSKKIQSKLHKTIKGVTEDIENLRYNLASIKIRELFNSFEEEISKEDLEAFIKLLNPICPHITEEWWEILGHKTYLCKESWPIVDENKIDEIAEFIDELSENTIKDIRGILKFANIENPKSIKLIVSPIWKYDFMKEFKTKIDETRNPGELIKHFMSGELKQHGQDITKLIPSLLKDASKMPKIILTQDEEFKNFSELKEDLEKEFSCELTIERSESSSEAKAKQASPSKPAIIVM